MKTTAKTVKTSREMTSWITLSSQIEKGPPSWELPMRLAGTWKQYSNRAIPQLSRMMDSIPKRSILDLKAICPYQANVIKVLERISRAMVARARLIIAEH